jgi:hypothetical protein
VAAAAAPKPVHFPYDSVVVTIGGLRCTNVRVMSDDLLYATTAAVPEHLIHESTKAKLANMNPHEKAFLEEENALHGALSDLKDEFAFENSEVSACSATEGAIAQDDALDVLGKTTLTVDNEVEMLSFGAQQPSSKYPRVAMGTPSGDFVVGKSLPLVVQVRPQIQYWVVYFS